MHYATRVSVAETNCQWVSENCFWTGLFKFSNGRFHNIINNLTISQNTLSITTLHHHCKFLVKMPYHTQSTTSDCSNLFWNCTTILFLIHSIPWSQQDWNQSKKACLISQHLNKNNATPVCKWVCFHVETQLSVSFVLFSLYISLSILFLSLFEDYWWPVTSCKSRKRKRRTNLSLIHGNTSQ